MRAQAHGCPSKYCGKFRWHQASALSPLALQVQLLAGTLPSRQLVQQYHLDQYLPLMEAMKRGDLALFDATMEKQQFQFIQEVGGVGG